MQFLDLGRHPVTTGRTPGDRSNGHGLSAGHYNDHTLQGSQGGSQGGRFAAGWFRGLPLVMNRVVGDKDVQLYSSSDALLKRPEMQQKLY